MDFEEENRQKVEIAKETFRRLGKFEIEDLEIVSDNNDFGYRNKIEYNFKGYEIAFFERGTNNLIPATKCLLAKEGLNQAIEPIINWLKENEVNPENLKSLLLRTNSKNEILAGIFLKTNDFSIKKEIKLNNNLIGISVYNAFDKKNKAPKALYSFGSDYLMEILLGKPFKYGILNFFQVNLPLFEKTLKDLLPFVEQEPLLDFYSGVGSIGIALGDHLKSCTLVESDSDSSLWANRNAILNNLTKFHFFSGKTEELLEKIKAKNTVVFDPPRNGLNYKILNRLNEVKPKRIIYLSCDISTQAANLKQLLPNYKMVFKRLYNYFPRTPHIESLIVLEALPRQEEDARFSE